MKIKTLVVAGCLAAAGPLAWADDTPLGLLGANPALLAATVDGLTSQGFSFSLGGLSTVFGSVGANTPGLVAGVSISNGLGTLSDNNATDGFSFTGLGAGSYTLTLFAYSATAASVQGTLAATPVPEPETYAMMLAGLGALAFMAVRRR